MKKAVFIESTMKRLAAEQAALEKKMYNLEKAQNFIAKNEARHEIICRYFKVFGRRLRYGQQFGNSFTDFKSEMYHKAITAILENPNIYCNPLEGEKQVDVTIRGSKEKNFNAVCSSVRNVLVAQGILTKTKTATVLKAMDGHYRTLYLPSFSLTPTGKEFATEWINSFR